MPHENEILWVVEKDKALRMEWKTSGFADGYVHHHSGAHLNIIKSVC